MNKTEKLAAMKQMLLLTEAMQEKAHEQLWEEIAPLELQRQTFIDLVFPLDPADVSLREILEQVVTLNSNLEAQCRQGKNKLEQELTSMNIKKKAMSAYLMS